MSSLASNIVYTSEPLPGHGWTVSKNTVNAIKNLGKFTDRLKDANYDTVKNELLNVSFVEKATRSLKNISKMSRYTILIESSERIVYLPVCA